MSTCISRHGEFSEHVLGRDADRFTCQWCFVFDEDAALQRIAELEAALAGRTVVELPEPDRRDVHFATWTVSTVAEWTSVVEAGMDENGPVVVCDHGELDASMARALGLAYLAAADHAERLADSPDGGPRG